jgi:general secretion pathway protein M
MALTILPPKGQGQVMAAGLLLVVLGLFYFFCLHWFVQGHVEVASEINDLKESELRFRQEVSKRPSLQARLVEVEEFKARNTYFLPEETFDLAAAALSTKLKDAVTSKAETTRCAIISTQPQHLGTKELYERVSIQVRLKCDMDDLVKIMYSLENATPLMFIDELNLYQQPVLDASLVSGNGGNMDARFDLSGYIRNPPTERAKTDPMTATPLNPFSRPGSSR